MQIALMGRGLHSFAYVYSLHAAVVWFYVSLCSECCDGKTALAQISEVKLS